MINPLISLVQQEDLLRWAKEPLYDFCLKYLWYPKHVEFTELGLYCLFNNK